MNQDQNLNYDIYDSLPERFNFVSYLFDQIKADELPKIAFVHETQAISFEDLICQVKQWAGLFKSFKINVGTRVGILLPDCLEFVYAYLATLWLGGIAVIVNEAYSDADIEHVIDDSRVDFLVSRKHWFEKFGSRFQSGLHWTLVDDPDFLDQLSQANMRELPTLLAREAQAFWVYTSGSTGRPKGVIHSHHNPVVAIHTYGKHILKLSTQDTVLSAPPMAFSYGLGTSLYFPLFARAKVILTSEVSPFEMIRLVNQHKVTVFFGIPHNYASIYAVREILPLQPESLRLCICAGEQLPISAWKNWHDNFGIKICEGIGTTESTHIFISNSDDCMVPGSTGKAVPGYEIRLVDEQGRELQEVNQPGFLEVTGEGFTLGYWNRLKATQSLLRGQTMRTGDIYRVDEAGQYYFMGRKDSLIKVKGMWIAPSEIEEVYLKHPSVVETAVIVEPGLIENTVEIVAYLRLKDEEEMTRNLQNQMNSLAKLYLPKYKIPRKLIALKEFPRTATGKIHRTHLGEIT